MSFESIMGKSLYETPITNLYFNSNLPQYQSVPGYQPFSTNNTNRTTTTQDRTRKYNTITDPNGLLGDKFKSNPNPDPNKTTSTFAQNAEVGVNVASSVMNALSGMSNIALGWATYAEQKKNSEMQRQLAAKQLQNLDEIMTQRREELQRLNRVRGNTKKAFSSNTTVTRSVL